MVAETSFFGASRHFCFCQQPYLFRSPNTTTMGNSTSRDGVAAIAAQLANVALGKEDVRSFEMEAVPMELWEVIFNFTEDKTLAIAVPQINKYTRNLAHPNCGIWRAKCKSKGIEAPNENMTWKKRYFASTYYYLINFFVLSVTHQK